MVSLLSLHSWFALKSFFVSFTTKTRNVTKAQQLLMESMRNPPPKPFVICFRVVFVVIVFVCLFTIPCNFANKNCVHVFFAVIRQ